MTEKTTYDRIVTIIVEHIGLSQSRAEEITRDNKIIDDLGADSLDVIEIAMAIEEEFDINISDEKLHAIVTIQDAVKLVESELAADGN